MSDVDPEDKSEHMSDFTTRRMSEHTPKRTFRDTFQNIFHHLCLKDMSERNWTPEPIGTQRLTGRSRESSLKVIALFS